MPDKARKMSIVDPSSCGFAKACSYHLFTEKPNSKKKATENSKEYSSRILRDQYARFLSQFQYFQPSIDYTKFKSNFREITKNLQYLGKKFPEKKKTILSTFSWINLYKLKDKQKYHSLFDCQACYKSVNLRSALVVFTNQCNKYKVKAKNEGLFDNFKLKEQTNNILNDLNKDYPKKWKATFTKQAKEIFSIPNPKLIAHTIKENIELQMDEPCFER